MGRPLIGGVLVVYQRTRQRIDRRSACADTTSKRTGSVHIVWRPPVSGGTAAKIVAAFAFGGIFLALWTGKTGADKYRKVWGVTLLSAAGAALADFAPGLVGPYFGLIIFAYASGHLGSISSTVSQVKTQAGAKKNA